MRKSVYVWAVVCAVLCAAHTALAQQPVRIAVFGDMPYVAGVREPEPILRSYGNVLRDIDRADVECVVHLGDYTNGPLCGDSLVAVRYAEFNSMSHPFVFVFGDNDWTDCARGGFDPLERLARLRNVFATGDTTLGRKTLRLERQSANSKYSLYRENVRWRMGNVLLVGMNVPGSNNNWGKDSVPSAEYTARNAANLAWLREAFATAQKENLRGVAIFIQANPGFDRTQMSPQDLQYVTGFDDFLRVLSEETIAFGKPVALIHGDTHYFRIDKPMIDSTGQRSVAHFTRAEGFGALNMHWLRLTIDDNDPSVFSFTPVLVQENLK